METLDVLISSRSGWRHDLVRILFNEIFNRDSVSSR